MTYGREELCSSSNIDLSPAHEDVCRISASTRDDLAISVRHVQIASQVSQTLLVHLLVLDSDI